MEGLGKAGTVVRRADIGPAVAVHLLDQQEVMIDTDASPALEREALRALGLAAVPAPRIAGNT